MIRPLLTIALLAAAWAGEAAVPTREQWEPVRAAIDGRRPDAESRLGDLLVRFPTWADGRLALATLKAEQQDWRSAYAAAREAIKLDGANPAAGALAVQALGRLGRSADAVTVAKRYDKPGADPQGLVAYQAAAALAWAKDAAGAGEWLAKARAARKDPGEPKEFAFLAGRLAVLGGDLVQAEAALQRATAADPAYWDAWYELGRVRLALAGKAVVPAEREALLGGARAAMDALIRQFPQDAEARTYLGRIHLAIGRAAAGQAARTALLDAEQQLSESLRLQPGQLPAQLALGETYARLGRYAEAVAPLQAAVAAGVQDREVLYNLATALTRIGKADEAQAILAKVGATTGGELITAGMNAYAAGNHALAAQMLEQAAAQPDVRAQPGLAAASQRYAGHAQRRMAEGPERDARLDAAAGLYRMAGDAGDWSARHWYTGLQGGRDADRAYAAGWQVLSWSSYLSPTGWSLVLGNYGAAATGGDGLGGMWSRKPLHVIVWALIILLPIGLFIWVRTRPEPAQPAAQPPPARRPTPRPTAVTTPLPRPPVQRPRGETTKALRTPAPRPPETRR